MLKSTTLVNRDSGLETPEQCQEISIFDTLPREIQLLVLSFLKPEELCNIASVSKCWEVLSSANQLWKSFIKKPAPNDLIFFIKELNYKNYYKLITQVKRIVSAPPMQSENSEIAQIQSFNLPGQGIEPNESSVEAVRTDRIDSLLAGNSKFKSVGKTITFFPTHESFKREMAHVSNSLQIGVHSKAKMSNLFIEVGTDSGGAASIASSEPRRTKQDEVERGQVLATPRSNR